MNDLETNPAGETIETGLVEPNQTAAAFRLMNECSQAPTRRTGRQVERREDAYHARRSIIGITANIIDATQRSSDFIAMETVSFCLALAAVPTPSVVSLAWWLIAAFLAIYRETSHSLWM